MKVVDVTGKRFGRLTAVSRRASDGSNAWWSCVCECGSIKDVRLCHLQSGAVQSCGCSKKGRHRSQHGMTNTRVYRIWRQMHQRCENPNAEGYENYGGRGILVDKNWDNFPTFFEDMGQPPTEAHTLDRVETDKGYSKENCKWATWTEQHRNRRDNRLVTAFGQTKCMTEWAEEYKLPVSTLKNRLFRANMEPEAALTAPLWAKQRQKT